MDSVDISGDSIWLKTSKDNTQDNIRVRFLTMDAFTVKVERDKKQEIIDALQELSESGRVAILIESVPAERPGEAEEDAGEADESPLKLAINISNWLNKRRVARASFAKYLDRSKSHFTDMRNRPPSSMLAKHGKEAWIKIKEFLSDADAQKAFRGNMPKKRKRAEVETSEAVP